MGKEYGQYASSQLANGLYESLIGQWYNLEARGEIPQNAEEFANVVTHLVFDTLAAGVSELNLKRGLHEDDPRATED